MCACLFYECILLCMCTCMYVYVCMLVHARVCVGQMPTSDIFLFQFPPQSLRQNLFLNPELTKTARSSGEEALGIGLNLFPKIVLQATSPIPDFCFKSLYYGSELNALC